MKLAAKDIRVMTQTILLADDETTVRSMLATALEAAGYRVLVVGDGLEAVDVFRAHPEEIDLVVLDLTMPRMGGDEAFREIAGIRPNAKVLLSSGFAENESGRNAEALRPFGFVQKPYRIANFVRIVTQALQA
jgi:two-component system, cell cycle sensor histidine kinase and response regulator CckA